MTASQIAPSEREDVELDGRHMSPARRARIIAKFGGKCAYPGCEEARGLEVDHIVALALGGRDLDDNLEPLCEPHHAAKTARDIKMISKAKRLEATRKGLKPPPMQRLRSRNSFRKRWP